MATDVVEVVEQMTEDEARMLTDQIVGAANDLWELVRLAYTGRAWAALGYESWDDYLSTELIDAQWAVARDERPQVVGLLREAGMSIRAIAATVGASSGTVHGILDAEEVDLDAEIVGTDGKTYKPKRKPRPPKGEKKEPKAPAVSNIDMLAIGRPDQAPDGTFPGVGFGDPDFGACVIDGEVRWYASGSYDEITPEYARFLASCLLAAADVAES